MLAVAITGQADGVWLVDDKGEPVCNAINWTDSRALDKCVQWMSDGTDRKIFEIIGSTFYPGSQIVLTSWLLGKRAGAAAPGSLELHLQRLDQI